MLRKDEDWKAKIEEKEKKETEEAEEKSIEEWNRRVRTEVRHSLLQRAYLIDAISGPMHPNGL